MIRVTSRIHRLSRRHGSIFCARDEIVSCARTSRPRMPFAIIGSSCPSPSLPLRSSTKFFSSSAGVSGDPKGGGPSDIEIDASSTSESVDDVLEKFFQDSQLQSADALTSSSSDIVSASATSWDPTWYNLSDQAILAVQTFHQMSGLEFGWSIVGVTVILRLALFPLMVQSQRTTSRMAHLQPELTMIKQRYEALGTPSRQDQLQFSKQMKALFDKYQVKPFRAFAAPLVQLPCFMGMFFGLKKMPTLFHDELATGGMFWFPDLTISDPLYILPFASAGTFLALIEMGKDQMMAQNAAQGKLMVNVFRVMSVAMIPVCINFESAMLCYWTANNVLTIAQTGLLKSNAARKYFGIWDAPKPVPGLEPESLTEAVGSFMKRMQGEATTDKQLIERHNQAVEVKKRARAFQMSRGKHRSSGVTGISSSRRSR